MVTTNPPFARWSEVFLTRRPPPRSSTGSCTTRRYCRPRAQLQAAGREAEPDAGVRRGGSASSNFTAGPTAIKALHLPELRERIDALRVRHGLVAFPWTDPTILPGVTAAKAAHLTELRAALNAAYVAAQRDVPVYTDATNVARVTPVRTVHWTEFQQAVVALEP